MGDRSAENTAIAVLRRQEQVLLETVSGSQAYGLATPESDLDTKGVFAMTRAQLLGLHPMEQVSSARHDDVFYELGRFVQLLGKNNPNLIELLAMPPDCIRYRHPLMERFQPELFLSKLCRDTFAGYAKAQIQKARGLNKKILNPFPRERKSPLDFCYVVRGQGSELLRQWLQRENLSQERCGLVNVPHMRGFYALFYDLDDALGFRGIVTKPSANEVALSSVPPGLEPRSYLYFNRDGYSTYCKDYREYWRWVKERNDVRYQATLAHGKRYDAKNMMHTFRLLRMAREILAEGKILVRRPDREELLAIRRGDFEYDELVAEAEGLLQQVDAAYAQSPLPPRPDREAIEKLLIAVREEWYQLNVF